MEKTFYFNTGVRPESGGKLFGREVWKDGTMQIPFTCNDVPDNAIFLFACSNENLPESKTSSVIVRRIIDSGVGGILSKFAYFKIKG